MVTLWAFLDLDYLFQTEANLSNYCWENHCEALGNEHIEEE
jgi:hypothetical protein